MSSSIRTLIFSLSELSIAVHTPRLPRLPLETHLKDIVCKMKIALIPTLMATSALGLNIGRGQNTAQVTFIGAADAQFTQDFPIDGSVVKISQ